MDDVLARDRAIAITEAAAGLAARADMRGRRLVVVDDGQEWVAETVAALRDAGLDAVAATDVDAVGLAEGTILIDEHRGAEAPSRSERPRLLLDGPPAIGRLAAASLSSARPHVARTGCPNHDWNVSQGRKGRGRRT